MKIIKHEVVNPQSSSSANVSSTINKPSTPVASTNSQATESVDTLEKSASPDTEPSKKTSTKSSIFKPSYIGGKVKGAFNTSVEATKAGVSGAYTSTKSGASSAYTSIKGGVKTSANATKSGVSSAYASIKGAIIGLATKAGNALSAAGASIKSAAIGVKNSVSKLFTKSDASAEATETKSSKGYFAGFKSYFAKAPKADAKSEISVDETPAAGSPEVFDAEKASKLDVVSGAPAADETVVANA